MFANKERRFKRSCVTEIGLSDFHKITITVLKIQFRKLEPKVISCRNYKNFSNDIFLKSLNSELSKYSFSPDESGFGRFCQICTDTLKKYVPHKEKTIKGNHSPFINNEISKAIMERTRLRNIYLKLRTIESKSAYTSKKIIALLLLENVKRNIMVALMLKILRIIKVLENP